MSNDDMAVIAELLRDIQERLSSLENLNGLAKASDVQALAQSLSSAKIEIPATTIDKITTAARIGAKDGGASAGAEKLQGIETSLNKYTESVISLSESCVDQHDKIGKWNVQRLAAALLIGLICGGVIGAMYAGKSAYHRQASSFSQAMLNPERFVDACQAAGGDFSQKDHTAFCFWSLKY